MFTSGILHRFGHELHGDPTLVFQALVARAHDACEIRATSDPGYSPAILVTTQSTSGRVLVSVCDNGAPLPADDVKQLYAAIRTGRVGSFKRALAAHGADAVVGKVGVALLGAFVLADQVGIVTRGANSPEGVRYLCTSRTYVAEPYAVPRPGTTFQLRMRPEAAALSDVANVRQALLPHADSFATPIRVGSDTRPISSGSCPRS